MPAHRRERGEVALCRGESGRAVSAQLICARRRRGQRLEAGAPGVAQEGLGGRRLPVAGELGAVVAADRRLDPLDASVIYIKAGEHVLVVDM